MEEIWKDIEGYEGRYQVSNYGRVKSLEFERPTKCNATRITKEKILSKRLDSKGYSFVMLYDGAPNNKAKSYKVHRLVASAFISNKDNKPQVNHKDLNKSNNLVDNLEWVTQSENIQHALRNGAMRPTYGKRPEYWRSRIAEGVTKHQGKPVVQLTLENEIIDEYPSINEASRSVFGTEKTHIGDCCKGTRTMCGGYKWRFKEMD